MRKSGYEIIGEEIRKYSDSLKLYYGRFIVRISADGEEFNDFVYFENDGTLVFDMDWDEGQLDFKLIKIIPLAELFEERPTAEWININGIKTCNQCGIGIASPYDHFCPNCGAKMKK